MRTLLFKCKLHDAVEYHEDGEELKAFQCLSDISSMIDDLFEVKKINRSM